MSKILVLDDELGICSSLRFALEDSYKVFTANYPAEGIELIKKESIPLVLLDLKLGQFDGMEILKELLAIDSDIVVIMMTAYGNIKSSVEAMKAGAYDYIAKPLDMEQLYVLLDKGLNYYRLNKNLKSLEAQIEYAHGNGRKIIGKGKEMHKVFGMIEKVKDIGSNILLRGESGTGKELVAKEIHYGGKRKHKPFEAVNCAAIPKNLLESELFGHVRGAFTGAVNNKQGMFSAAADGTIFLDEIAEMDISLQAKLLRVLEEKEFTPVGSNDKVPLRARIISATNNSLEKQIQEGRFREDLYYRLNVISFSMPPLRERKEDLPHLIYHFIKTKNKFLGKQVSGILPEALAVLENHEYKGNVRELENIIERAVALTTGEVLGLQDLPWDLVSVKTIEPSGEFIIIQVGETLKEVERKLIIKTLDKLKGSRKKTAVMLGISERNLRNKIKEYQQRDN